MQLPFDLPKDAEMLEGFEIGQTIPGTNFRVLDKLSRSPGYATYSVMQTGADDSLFVCELLPISGSTADSLEAVATNSLFCNRRTRSPNIANIAQAAWLRDGSYYQIIDVSKYARIWDEEYNGSIISANDFRVAAHQLMNALLYIHKSEIVHCAINPSSIVIDGGSHKLSGFWWARNLLGSAFDSRIEKFYPYRLSTTAKATLAPEINSGGRPTRESDLYSLGATFFFMLTGEYPFNSTNDAARPEHLQELRPDLTPQMVRGVQLMLEHDPMEREMFAIMSRLAPLPPESDDDDDDIDMETEVQPEMEEV